MMAYAVKSPLAGAAGQKLIGCVSNGDSTPTCNARRHLLAKKITLNIYNGAPGVVVKTIKAFHEKAVDSAPKTIGTEK